MNECHLRESELRQNDDAWVELLKHREGQATVDTSIPEATPLKIMEGSRQAIQVESERLQKRFGSMQSQMERMCCIFQQASSAAAEAANGLRGLDGELSEMHIEAFSVHIHEIAQHLERIVESCQLRPPTPSPGGPDPLPNTRSQDPLPQAEACRPVQNTKKKKAEKLGKQTKPDAPPGKSQENPQAIQLSKNGNPNKPRPKNVDGGYREAKHHKDLTASSGFDSDIASQSDWSSYAGISISPKPKEHRRKSNTRSSKARPEAPTPYGGPPQQRNEPYVSRAVEAYDSVPVAYHTRRTDAGTERTGLVELSPIRRQITATRPIASDRPDDPSVDEYYWRANNYLIRQREAEEYINRTESAYTNPFSPDPYSRRQLPSDSDCFHYNPFSPEPVSRHSVPSDSDRLRHNPLSPDPYYSRHLPSSSDYFRYNPNGW
jgi:hypothetical protein